MAWMPLQSGVLGGQVVVLRGRLHTVVTFNDGSAAVVDSSQLARAPGRARRKRRARQDAALHGARVVAWLDEPFAKARGRQGLTACCMTSGKLPVWWCGGVVKCVPCEADLCAAPVHRVGFACLGVPVSWPDRPPPALPR